MGGFTIGLGRGLSGEKKLLGRGKGRGVDVGMYHYFAPLEILEACSIYA